MEEQAKDSHNIRISVLRSILCNDNEIITIRDL